MSSNIRPEDLSPAARERLARDNPELAGQILGRPEPEPAPEREPERAPAREPERPAPADELAPRRSARSSRRRSAPARRSPTLRTITRSAPARELGSIGATALVFYFLGATIGTVILVELLSPRGSASASTIVGTFATGIRRLADPADPLIPAA